MPESKDSPFGNLAFDHYTLDSEAEKSILALQAALTVAGYTDGTPTMKGLTKLKRSMKRNSVRRYTFAVRPVIHPAGTLPEKPVLETFTDEELTPFVVVAYENASGLTLHHKTVKKASSGHMITDVFLAGKEKDCLFDVRTPDLLQEHVAVLLAESNVLSSFVVQFLRAKSKDENIVVHSQCLYK